MNADGYTTLNYTLQSQADYQLFTHLLVDLPGPRMEETPVHFLKTLESFPVDAETSSFVAKFAKKVKRYIRKRQKSRK